MTYLRIPVLAATVGFLAVTACTDVNTPTNNPKQRTNEGAAAGAAAGVLFGLATGDTKKERRKNAVLGAVVGGVAGGLIGNSLDKQAAELQSAIGDSRIQIINTGDVLIVRMPQDILFATNSATVSGALYGDLGALAANLQRYPGSTVEVTGHTDNTGSAAYNQSLSSQRANSVAAVLINNGVSSGRVRTFGAGESQPIASNLTPQGRAQNRRVEIVIRPRR